MPVFDINDVSVKFPFEPYPVQREYMKKVIETLDSGHNAFLESPTGTGKTLSLLCSVLGWVEELKEKKKRNVKKDNQSGAMGDIKSESNAHDFTHDVFRRNYISPFFPQVIYSSRTHSQLSQAMNELKQTEYSYMKAGIVASRDQLCINEELKYIEELGRVGQLETACPYYMSKELAKRADIVFMPYNYLLDPKIRFANKIDLKNAIVIFDESHNVENMCEESASTIITSTTIAIAIRDIKYIIENGLQVENMVEKDKAALAELIQKLETEIFKIQMKSGSIGGDSYDGNFIFELLKKVQINESNHETILDHLHGLIGTLVNASRNQILVTESGYVSQKCPSGIGLRALSSFLRVVFSSSAPHLRDRVIRCYKIYIEREPDKKTTVYGVTTVEKAHPKAKIINVWCFSAAFGMQYLLQQNLRSLIFTSGTLAPLKPLITEMEIPNPVQLVNPHILRPFQVSVKIVSCGPDNEMLKSNYDNRENEAYLRSLGRTIVEFSKVVPDGLLIFFPSYKVMNICKEFWQSNDDMWSSINKQKRIFEEPREGPKEEFVATMKDYYATINEPNSNGAIFMAVMRGKVSEGLDFADMYGRAVIVTGIPFAPCNDPKIRLKKKYLDDTRRQDKEMMSGDEWYNLSASRAINQAIGRVIRHKDDYGAILLCDNRFYTNSNQKNISGWLKVHLEKSYPAFNSMISDLGRFYENAKNSLPKPKPRVPEIVDFEDDPSVLDELTDAKTTGLTTMGGKYDDGPIPRTPFKSFGESSRDTDQSELERKRRKLVIDSNESNDMTMTC
ncbi:regulator of telomere elongation helicase 1 homolog isoform X2 [Sitodiplosis mosellana]|uniref:regulator of telomere elongation helicase 1 homolog isoform X2 n=1 Tax=Sitodiplosis mosellana TaxID=263140 RepID=UPI0024451DA2|nr:regulator of telomere elongation helicase 1 homolog isoform X2 [Sitodiplosis mosellana]